MFALLMMGHSYLVMHADGGYGWTGDRNKAHRFQDGTAARSYRDWKRLPSFVAVVDERGCGYRG